MYCKKCGTNNSDNALRCKNCKDYLVNQYLNENLNANENQPNDNKNLDTNTNNTIPNKSSNNQSHNKKTKNKKRKKIKKQIINNKKSFFKKDNQDKKKNTKNNQEIIIKQSSFSRITIIFLTILVLILLIVCGGLSLYILKDKVVQVPNIIGLKKEEAIKILNEKEINYELIEEKTTIENEIGIIIKQDKKAETYILKTTTITITVGSNDTNNTTTQEKDSTPIYMDNLIGKTKKEAIQILNSKKINYTIIEIESTEDDIVINQSISPGEIITTDTTVTLYVSKSKTIESPDNSNTTDLDTETTN